MDCEFCGADVQPGALACPRCGGPAPKQPTPGPGPGVEAAPDSVPLARLEDDVFALAEETVVVTEEGVLAVAETPPADAASLADADVPPGIDIAPEPFAIDTSLTGGYKGPEGPSVAGAGSQTPDDPFGLNITEAPPSAAPARGGGFDFRSTWNIVVMVLALLAALAIIFAGIYFGLIRKSDGSEGPAGAAREFFEAAVAGDSAGLESLSAPGSTLAEQVKQVLLPYSRQGPIAIKSLEIETTSAGDRKATIGVTGFEVEVATDGGPVTYDLLEHTKPFPLTVSIKLVNEDGKWLVSE